MINENHQANQIVVELKNIDPIDDHIDSIQKYFGKHIGNFGILEPRSEAAKDTSTRQLSLYNLQDRVTLVMGDQYIHNMLHNKAAGADLVQIIEEIYNDFFK